MRSRWGSMISPSPIALLVGLGFTRSPIRRPSATVSSLIGRQDLRRVWRFGSDVPTRRPRWVLILTERDSLLCLPTQNVIDHKVSYHLNRFKACQNLVITDRQPEPRTPPITLSTETTRTRPGEPALGPQFPADDPSDARSAFGGLSRRVAPIYERCGFRPQHRSRTGFLLRSRRRPT